MIQLEILLISLSLIAYLATAVIYLRHLFGGREFWGRATLTLLIIGLGVHFLALVVHVLADPKRALPLVNVLETLSLAAWCLVFVFVLAELRWRITALGAFVLPIALAAMVGSFFALHHHASAAPKFLLEHQALLGVHVTLVLVGYAAFVLAFCSALAYLLQDRFLRSKHFQGISRQLPPVQVADEAAYRLAALGFPVFTLGLIIGAIWAYLARPGGWWDPKVVWSIVTWLVFVTYLHARMASGWKGRKAAVLLVTGFVCVVATYVLTGLLKAGWHRFV